MDTDSLCHLLKTCTTVAIVGLSNKKHRESYATARYLQAHGYRIIPVTPRVEEILGQRCYPNLLAIPHRIDIVDCFVRADRIPAVAEEAITVGSRMLWMQTGIVNEEASRRASAAGLQVVMNRCLMLEHKRLLAQ